MPSPSYIPSDNQNNGLGGLLKGFLGRANEIGERERESDALKDIYSQFQNDGQNIEKQLQAINSDPRISPTTRVNTAAQLLKMAEYNEGKAKRAKEELDKENKKKQDAAQIRDLEQRSGLKPGELAPYEGNLNAALKVVKPKGEKNPIGGLGGVPLTPAESKAIKDVIAANPEATAEDLELAFNEAGITPGRTKELLESRRQKETAKNKGNLARDETIAKELAKNDVDFVTQQLSSIPQLHQQRQVLDQARKLNNENVTGHNWDIIMQKAGLLQYTSSGYREFSSVGKDVIKNVGIKDTVGSQISAMEFRFFVDATINPNFTKEANDAIIRKDEIALRYKQLYADITAEVIRENKGQIPELIQQKVNAEFKKQSEKMTDELKEAAADYDYITEVPADEVLMFTPDRKPIHVKKNQVTKYSKPPYNATLK